MVIIQRILRGVGKEIKNNTVYDFSQSIFKVILYLGKRTWYDYKLNLILRVLLMKLFMREKIIILSFG